MASLKKILYIATTSVTGGLYLPQWPIITILHRLITKQSGDSFASKILRNNEELMSHWGMALALIPHHS